MFSFHFWVGHRAPSKSLGGGGWVGTGAGDDSGKKPGGGVIPGGSDGCCATTAPMKSENFIFGENFSIFDRLWVSLV